MDKKKILYWLLLPGILVSLIGCAVMTVDVDVYKGPLANHEDVQIEQMAVMAIGAKPLLIQLRDHLEWQEKGVSVVESKRSKKWYVDGYIPRSKYKTWSREDAHRVNIILSLYEDKIPSELSPLYNEGRDTYYKFLYAFYTLRPIQGTPLGDTSKKKSKEIWNEIEKGLRDFSNKPENIKILVDNLKIDKSIVEKLYKSQAELESRNLLDNLKVAYEAFLDGKNDWRDQDGILNAHTLLWDKLKTTGLLNGLALTSQLLDVDYDKDHSSNTSANSEFDILRAGALVKAHANLLFRSDANTEKQKFISRVREIADSFFAVRINMDKLLEMSLKGMSLIHNENLRDKIPVEKVHHILAEFAVSLIDPKYLWCALENKNTDLIVERFKFSLRNTFLEEGHALKEILEVRSNVLWYKNGLSKVLDDEDGSNARDLLHVHSRYINKFVLSNGNKGIFLSKLKKESNAGYYDKYEGDKQRNYGITPVSKEVLDGGRIKKLFDNIIDQLAGSMDRGRLKYGLETLIEQYLNSHADINSHDEMTKKEKENLIDALVRFAEKVLFIANNNSLLNPNAGFNKLDEYVMVLQAVGNSILVQADELQHRKSHQKNLTRRGKSELLALNQALRLSPKEVIDNVIAGLGADLREKEKQLRTEETKKQNAEKSVTEAEAELAKAQTSHDKADTDKVSAKTNHDNIVSSNQKYLDAYATMTGESADSIKKAVVKEEDITGVKLVDQIINWLKDKQSVAISKSEEIERLVNTIKYFDDLKGKSKVIHLSDKGEKVFGEISNIVKNNKVDIEKQIKAAKGDLDAKEKVFNDAKSQLAISKEKNAQAIADKTSAIAKHDTTSKDKTKLENSIAMINGIRTRLMNQINESGIEAPSAVFLLLVASIKEETGTTLKALETVKKEAVSEENKVKIANLDSKKDKLKDTIKILSGFTPPKDPSRVKELLSDNDKDEENQKEVMDNLIAMLRHDHVQSVRMGGMGHAKHIEEAIRLAYKYREGMVYIRPSGAYLRSSYPSTSLQGDPGLGWKNMLGQHGLRNIPFFGGMHKKDTKRKAKIVSEIDKQYWQNINRVRVAGAGRTNYVVAKDDIGNWYVKQYSADTQDIIKTARNLAMFNMSAQMGTNLLSRLPKEGELEEGGRVTGETPDANRSALDRLFEKYKVKYEGDTNSGFEGLIKILSEDEEDATTKKSRIVNRIYQSWSGNGDTKKKLTELDGRLDSAANGTLAPALKSLKDNSKKSVQVKAGEIINALHSTRRFHNVLTLGIRDLKLTDGPTKELASANETKKTKDKELGDAKSNLTKAEAIRKKADEDWKNKSQELKDKKAKEERKDKLAMDNLGKENYSVLKRDADEAKAGREKTENTVNDLKDDLDSAKTKEDTETGNVKTNEIAVQDADEKAKKAQAELDSAKNAEQYAMNEVTRIVREELMKFVAVRKDVVGDYETGIMFIGDAIKE